MSTKNFFCPIHKEGMRFVVIALLATILIGMAVPSLGVIGGIITLYIIYFFRDPNRINPDGDNLVIAPADGVFQKIDKAFPPEELKMEQREMTRVTIFLNIFNVHVNRVPTAGVITDLNYRPGKFINASLDKASVDNERQSCVVKTKEGNEIVFIQIAGLIARRIVCDLKIDQQVATGERFGIIRFGSRMDIYMDSDKFDVLVKEGQTSIGGETIIAKVKN